MPNNTSERLDHQQITPITADELALLRKTAVALNITPGLLMRRLMLYALDHIDTLTLTAIGRDEALAVVERRRAAGRAAADQRWGRRGRGAKR